jgi:digeranylgeranylglycerophospholipid reductase
MNATCDVLVIGMGPAGGAAAARAASLGLRVTALERKREIGTPVQCAEFIPLPLSGHASSDVRRQRIAGMKSMLPSGALAATPFQGLMIDRAAFDRALAREAVTAGTELHAGTRLVGLRVEESVALARSAQSAWTIAYRVLIAADGPHSTVARLAGLPPLRTVDTRQYTVPLHDRFADTDIWLSGDYPGGYAWLFPKGEHANLGLGMDTRVQDDMKSPLDALHRQLVRQGRVGAAVLQRTGGAIPVGGLRPRLVTGNMVFAGDAGGFTHPVTGAGIAAAIASGERAAEAAHALLARDGAAALSDYEEDMREQFGPSIARGLARRRELERVWRTPEAHLDAPHRRGWIAFDEYYATAA